MAVAVRAVLFDVDFTLAKPGPDLGPEGYRRLGMRHGLDLDPGRYGEARRGACGALEGLDATPAEAAMVGDSVEDDIEGAVALGMRAFLIDRDGRHPEAESLP